MEMRVLQYFLAVAQEESISKAAEALHMTQPPLSRQLKDLEEELGKQLFVRGSRRITLTNEGQLLRKRAEEMLALMDKTKAEVSAANDVVHGDIYIGCAETDALRQIIKIIQAVQQDYPHINFQMFSGNAEDIAERLENGLFDFGVFIEPTDMRKYDFIRLSATDTWGLLMRKDCPLAEKPSIVYADLVSLPLIFTNQGMADNALAGWAAGDFKDLNIVATYNLPYVASLMVEEGVGYALCLGNIIQTAEGCPLCFRPLEPRLEVGINIGWKKYQVFSKAAEVFLQYLQHRIG